MQNVVLPLLTLTELCRSFNAEYAKNRLKIYVSLYFANYGQFYSTRDRRDGQAVVDVSFVGKIP